MEAWETKRLATPQTKLTPQPKPRPTPEPNASAEDALTGCRAMLFALWRMQHIVPETSVSVTKPRTASLRESGGLWERQAQHRSG